jgi:hypothetical protein
MALVIKQWAATERPQAGGEFVRIQGREAGLLSWLLSLVGIDPTTTLCIDGRSVRLEQGSLSGFARVVTPLPKVATAVYGYAKPWRTAVVVAAVGIALFAVHPIVGLIVLLGAPAYYFLNKQLFIEIRDTGAGRARIEFKRSVIESQNIDERAGERIVNIVEMLLLGQDQPRVSGHLDAAAASRITSHGSAPSSAERRA